MDHSRRVLFLVLIFVFLLFCFSVLQYIFNWGWHPLQRINLISDVVKSNNGNLIPADSAKDNIVVISQTGIKTEFGLYKKGNLITDFNSDTTVASLIHFTQQLHNLASGKKKKVRIAYFGDSMIEGDLITENLRKLLQQKFGGAGVGFVSIASIDAGSRTTVNHYSSGWTDKNFKTESGNSEQLYISGHSFYSSRGVVNLTDKTILDSNAVIEKSLLSGPVNASILVNESSFLLSGQLPVNRIILDNSTSHSIKLNVSNSSIPIYGISFETASGIFVDNFSFRGISGVEYAKIDTAMLNAVQASNAYDLIVVQYGVNVLYRPNDTNYNWYTRLMTPSVAKLHNAFSTVSMLLISCGDRAFRYNGEYKSAIGIDSLIRVQAKLASSANIAFYNLYESMGGEGTITAWANEDPPLANKDYVHPNRRGALILGERIFEALMKDYNKYKTSEKK